MKAVRIHDYKDEVKLEDVPKPNIKPNEVLLRVKAAALNPLDVQLKAGKLAKFFPLPFPYALGTDLSLRA